MVALARSFHDPDPDDRNSDPDAYRMSIGEHLEELRRRLVWALVGFGVALIVCFLLGRQMLTDVFCAPLIHELKARGLSTTIYYREMGEAFMVFMKISLVSALVLSGPWLLYQLWRFVAAGLYPHERRAVTRYVPLSITLLVAGTLFVYFLVLPWTVSFFLDFAGSMPPVGGGGPAGGVRQEYVTDPVFVTAIPGDPANPLENQIWINTVDSRLKVFLNGRVQELAPVGAPGLLTPQITLSDYVDAVLGMFLVFSLSFQLPLVVLALTRVGILETAALRAARRYVYFAMAILAAVITPGDFVLTMFALLVPLVLLYELGIALSRVGPGRRPSRRQDGAHV